MVQLGRQVQLVNVDHLAILAQLESMEQLVQQDQLVPQVHLALSVPLDRWDP